MSDAGGDRGGNKRTRDNSEEEIDTKQISVQSKRYYIDVKQNSRGRFIKICEVGSNYKSRLVLTMSAAVMIRDNITDLMAYSELNPSSEAENGGGENDKDKKPVTITIKSETISFDNRRYYLDLRENQRGRFLRVAQTVSNPRSPRHQINIPAEGMVQIRDVMAEMIDKHSEGYLTAPSAVDLPKSKQVVADNKAFYFDAGQNDRGVFVRVSEVKLVSGYRQSITIPESALEKFRIALEEVTKEIAEATPAATGDAAATTA